MLTSAQRWMSSAVLLSALVVGTFVTVIVGNGCSVFALVLAGLSVLVSLAILGAAGLVFLLMVWKILVAQGVLPEWLVQYENQELPPVDYYDGPRRP